MANLYKKYRPRKWEDMIGQEKIVESLKVMAQEEEIPTGMLFSGPPGTGKTTAAKIFAKAINCPNVYEGEPCNECDTCKAIDSDSSLGIHYISMANQGSADDVRTIVSEAQLSQPVKKQVWILDEAHNLSKQAFDALLIPLESESMKSIFIFCSTEPEKMAPAVMSRLQVKTFGRVPAKTLGNYIYKIAKKEDMNVTKEQILQILSISSGSVRNAIQNLEKINLEGELPSSYSEKIFEMLKEEDYAKLFILTNEMANESVDFTIAAQTLYSDATKTLTTFVGAPIENHAQKIAADLGQRHILILINIMNDVLMNMTNKVINHQHILEVGLMRIIMAFSKIKK